MDRQIEDARQVEKLHLRNFVFITVVTKVESKHSPIMNAEHKFNGIVNQVNKQYVCSVCLAEKWANAWCKETKISAKSCVQQSEEEKNSRIILSSKGMKLKFVQVEKVIKKRLSITNEMSVFYIPCKWAFP